MAAAERAVDNSDRPTDDSSAETAARARAWALWTGWRGSSVLLMRVLRAARDTLTETQNSVPNCRIEIHVPRRRKDDIADVETFGSIEEVAKVTEESLRHFCCIRASMETPAAGIDLMIARRKRKSGELSTGVLLDVRASATELDARELRQRVHAAIERGRPLGHSAPELGSGTDKTPEKLIREREQMQKRARQWSLVALLSLPVYLVFAGFALPGIRWWWLLLMIVGGGVLGVVPTLMWVWMFPSVELTDVGRSRRFWGSSLKIVATVLPPVVGAVGAYLLGTRK